MSVNTQDDDELNTAKEMTANGGRVYSPESPPNAHPEIEILRTRLAATLNKYPAYNTTFSLQRWLRSYRYDVDLVARKMENALTTLGNIGAFNNNVATPESIAQILRSITKAADYFPGGVMGTDRNGNIICVQTMGRVRPRNLICLGRVSDLYRASILECEATMAMMREQERKRGHKVSSVIISDIAGFGLDTIYMPAVKAYVNTLGLLQELFPDSITKVYIVNAPTALSVVFHMIKAVLSKKTVERIEFLGHNWKEVLRKDLGEENIFPHWGGTKKCDLPTGNIRMGGEIPSALKDEIRKSLMYLPKEQLKEVSVSARHRVALSVSVIRSGAKLSWYFTISSGDIDFWITSADKEVWPRFRLSTDFVAEYGEIVCHEPGTYQMHFDNSHGVLWSKQVFYRFEVDGLLATVI